jgi:hypothetical protein
MNHAYVEEALVRQLAAISTSAYHLRRAVLKTQAAKVALNLQ